MIFPDKSLQLEIKAEEELVIEASDKVLSVLIGNIIRNAWSYTDHGTVMIGIHDAKLVIEDSGAGIPDKEVENVFKPFNRGGNKRRGGYGVGLTIVNMLSERFDWPISVKSELNKGTEITIDFRNSVKN